MGYKSEQFVKPVDENLFCSICHEVFQDPVSCKDGHTFCSECIEQWLKTNKKCPLDNSEITDNKLPRNYIVKGIIDNLAVFCYYPDDDESKNDDSTQAQVGKVVEEKCSWTGKLQEVAKHRDVCGFQLVQCTHPKCTVKEQRRRIVDHKKTCKLKVIVCATCRVTMIQNDKDLHEKEYCPKTLVFCPKGCLTPNGMITKIRRMDLDDHFATVCGETLVDCPFKDQGCSVQVERQNVDKHVQDNMHMAAHMMLLAKENKQLKEELIHVKESLRKSKGSYIWLTYGRSDDRSPVFLECEHKWKLFTYFKVIDGFIVFYLAWLGDVNDLKTRDAKIPAFVRLSVLSNTPEKPHLTVDQCHTFTKVNDALEFRTFMKKIDAELPAYRSQGILKVECSIQLCYRD